MCRKGWVIEGLIELSTRWIRLRRRIEGCFEYRMMLLEQRESSRGIRTESLNALLKIVRRHDSG
ncbi:hypothetical protein HSB1_38520 [Halogranum salarium B-1]|uniref:Uncharacterized protein n=1 Tax=Halogranum salarium B-1 TaxID=1210908 RepID=J3EU22_9EURY|nr:hypothetical protein HSB1_38520 [Halogranum salarium B-1]